MASRRSERMEGRGDLRKGEEVDGWAKI